MLRTLTAGLAGGLTMNLVMLLTFRAIGFGWNGDGILLTSSIQSRKLIAVWTSLEPLLLIAIELSFWAVIAFAESFVIAAIVERGTGASQT
jgi:hypothetical protein